MTAPGAAPGLVLAAPASASGKTTLTLALLRHLRDAGVRVASCKAGPDYLDPAFHAAASGRPCRSLDGWAMRPETLAALAWAAGDDGALVIAEGVMGLFDGTAGGDGSTADLAAATGWPVVLVVDVKGQAASAAATVNGFHSFRPGLALGGVIFNRVGGDKHERMLRAAVAPLGVPVLGALRRHADLALPDRHLGLVQAAEHPDLETFLARAAAIVGREVDVSALVALARPLTLPRPAAGHRPGPPPLGQRLAVAQDLAFAFTYPWLLEAWRAEGAEILPFSPLADEAPPAGADAVYLPGGYPELHAGRLAGNARFLDGLRAAAGLAKPVLGECGGYMVLGQGLVAADGTRHPMAGLLGLESSFARRRLQLGYRRARLAADGPLGAAGTGFRGHEFHFATIVETGARQPLFFCQDAEGTELPPAGERRGSAAGSFLHLIDRA
ncbi:MAG: cobyrinate a,c-diamide synthase [Rhodospirillaceae bacterium]